MSYTNVTNSLPNINDAVVNDNQQYFEQNTLPYYKGGHLCIRCDYHSYIKFGPNQKMYCNTCDSQRCVYCYVPIIDGPGLWCQKCIPDKCYYCNKGTIEEVWVKNDAGQLLNHVCITCNYMYPEDNTEIKDPGYD